MNGKRIFWPLLTITLLFLIFCSYTLLRLYRLGAFTEIENDFEARVEVLATVPGPEDMELDRDMEILYFISSNPCTKSPEQGGIYWLPLKTANSSARKFTIDYPSDFHPHGLSLYKDSHNRYLFTNNHRGDGTHSVEVFKMVGKEKLEHQVTISGPELTSPNDLAAIGPRQFYLTNDGRSHDRFTRSLDTFLGRKTGNVLFYDGNQFIKAVDNLHFPNGIALNNSEKQLIIGETLSGFVRIYRLVENNYPRIVDNFFVGTGIDNISLDETGGLLIAIHPNLWALSSHMKDPSKPSPSKVMHIDLPTKRAVTVYKQQGNTISGVSTAVSFKGSLYLGAVCDDKLVKLEMINDE